MNIHVIDSSILSDVYVLEKGKCASLYDNADVFSKLLSLNRYGTNYHKAPLVAALGYFYPTYAPEVLYGREKDLLLKVFNNCKLRIITSDNAFEYADIISENVFLKGDN